MIINSKKVRKKRVKLYATICNENMRFLSNQRQDQLQIPTNQCIGIANMPIEGNEDENS